MTSLNVRQAANNEGHDVSYSEHITTFGRQRLLPTVLWSVSLSVGNRSKHLDVQTSVGTSMKTHQALTAYINLAMISA